MAQPAPTKGGFNLSAEMNVKEEVRQFYDSIGWKSIGEGLYQNARYEDLRPVSQEYIHRCHMRVKRFLPQSGRYLLDAGSGPIQYPEYLEYSKGYNFRVCLDISHLALMEARDRLGAHGLYVQGDIANLPFEAGVFEGIVSLHTIHHLPSEEQRKAFFDLARVLKPAGRAAVVYSWGDQSRLMNLFRRPIAWSKRFRNRPKKQDSGTEDMGNSGESRSPLFPTGTFTFKHDYPWFRNELIQLPNLEIRVWRTVSTAFMRAFIHPKLLGRVWLRLLYIFEELLPKVLGRYGQYPLILFQKPSSSTNWKR
jgi:hypothetical protein